MNRPNVRLKQQQKRRHFVGFWLFPFHFRSHVNGSSFFFCFRYRNHRYYGCFACVCKRRRSVHRFKHFICFNNVFYPALNPNVLCTNMIFTLHFTALMRIWFECVRYLASSIYVRSSKSIRSHTLTHSMRTSQEQTQLNAIFGVVSNFIRFTIYR